MFTALRSMIRDPEGRVVLLWAFGQIVLGTVVFMRLEHWSAINALYFSVITLATVGFGDLHPTTDIAKLFTVVYVLFGLGVIAAFISQITQHRAAAFAKYRPHRQSAGDEPGPASEGA